MVFNKGGKRRKYGGTVTKHGLRKGDFVETERKGAKYRGWISGDTKTQVSVSDINWKRLGQFSAKKTKLLKRSTNLICKPIYGGNRPKQMKMQPKILERKVSGCYRC